MPAHGIVGYLNVNLILREYPAQGFPVDRLHGWKGFRRQKGMTSRESVFLLVFKEAIVTDLDNVSPITDGSRQASTELAEVILSTCSVCGTHSAGGIC